MPVEVHGKANRRNHPSRQANQYPHHKAFAFAAFAGCAFFALWCRRRTAATRAGGIFIISYGHAGFAIKKVRVQKKQGKTRRKV